MRANRVFSLPFLALPYDFYFNSHTSYICTKYLQKGVVWCRHWHVFGEAWDLCIWAWESEIFLRQYASFQFPSFPFQLAIRSLGAHITKERVCFNNKHREENTWHCLLLTYSRSKCLALHSSCVVWFRHWHVFGEVWDLCIWAWEYEENTVVIYMYMYNVFQKFFTLVWDTTWLCN